MSVKRKIKLYFLSFDRGNEKGIVLIAALALVAILALVGTTAVITTNTELKISGNYKTSTQAFYVSEAGYNRLIGEYLNNPDYYTDKAGASDMGFSYIDPDTANFGTNQAYWFPSITYESSSPPTYVDIESYGKVLSTNSLAKTRVRLTAEFSSLFDMGLFGDEGITLCGNGETDSYDSSTDPTALNLLSNGDIGTNAIGPGIISLCGNAAINGDAIVGPGGNTTDVTTTGNAVVNGNNLVASSPKDLTPMTDPGGGMPETLNLSGNSSKTISSGTYRLPSISISGNGNGYIDGDVTMYVEGTISTSGNGKLVIQDGGSLTIYVMGTVSISGNGIVNQNSNPRPVNFMLFGTASCTSVTISGNGTTYSVIYAPEANISVTGNGDIYGAAVGDAISITGNGDIFYDESLKDLNGTKILSDLKVTLWELIGP
ncbi:MAG: PilX N-terminal domain-containing pilus assembly protein [Candidatus Brocadiaceae bacterium]|nr:PilX N-terminal domain-containing pilus assembly protein [Candidatus Brocadiaceae bacterium]